MSRTARALRPLLAGFLLAAAAAASGWSAGGGSARAEELRLCDNTRVSGWVQRVTPDGKVEVLLPTGEAREIPLEDIVSIRFLGRDPLLIQAGTQEFRFASGGRLRGQILGNEGDAVRVQTAAAGTLDLDLARFKGFLSLPQVGFVGRKAEDLVESDRGKRSPHVDVILDEGGGDYPGVVRRLKRTGVDFDVDEFLQTRFFPVLYVKGVRLADAGRDKPEQWGGDVQVFLWTRDGSVVRGKLEGVHLGKWRLRPAWDPKTVVELGLEEIVLAQVLGGKVQYLSQLTPVDVREKTVLAPPQPGKMDRNSQGGALSIAGSRYPWGIGVHADSEMTFVLDGRYQEFRSDAGIDTSMGARGSVRFVVLGDGQELYKSPPVRGSDLKPLEIAVPIAGVKRLTLKVTGDDDLDMGDMADWGAAMVVRGGPAAPARKEPAAAPAKSGEAEKTGKPAEPAAGKKADPTAAGGQ